MKHKFIISGRSVTKASMLQLFDKVIRKYQWLAQGYSYERLVLFPDKIFLEITHSSVDTAYA